MIVRWVCNVRTVCVDRNNDNDHDHGNGNGIDRTELQSVRVVERQVTEVIALDVGIVCESR